VSGSAALLLALDLAATYAKSQMELNAVMQKAALEGREVSMNDLDNLIAQSTAARNEFDAAVAKHRGEV